MSNIRIDLTKIKASGVYTFEFDQSESIIVSQQTIKLVIGFSRVGPYNTTVFLNDTQTARTVFGDIDPFLERRNCFFHRTILKGLETGPVFAVNLLNLNNEIPLNGPDNSDKVSYRTFSLETNINNGIKVDKLLSSYYNKEKFWFPETDSLLATRNLNDKDKLFSIVNLGQNPQTILVRKPQDLLGFDITVSDWFGSDNIPSFLYPFDLISDYFIQVLSVNGDFGPDQYAQLSIDPTFSDYFTVDGLIQEKLDDFLELPEVTFNATYTGCVIPDFVDKSNVNYYIQNLINVSTNSTGLFCAIDENLLDEKSISNSKIDMVGHRLISSLTDDTFNTLDFLSYKTELKETIKYEVLANQTQPTDILPFEDKYQVDLSTSLISYGISSSDGKFVVTLDRAGDFTGNNYENLINSIQLGRTIVPMTNPSSTFQDYYLWTVDGLSVTNSTFSLTLSADFMNDWQSNGLDTDNSGSGFVDGFNDGILYIMDQDSQFDSPNNPGRIEGFYNSTIYEDFRNGNIVDGDIIYTDVPSTLTSHYVRLLESTKFIGVNNLEVDIVELFTYSDDEFTTLDLVSFTDQTYEADKLTQETTATEINVISLQNSINYEVEVTTTNEGNKFIITQDESSKLSVGDYIVSLDETHLTRVIEMATDVSDVSKVNVTTLEAVSVNFNKIDVYKKIDDLTDIYDLTYLQGFKLKDSHIPNGTDERMNEILNVMTDYNIFAALADKDLLEYRYIVDCFGGGLESQCKGILAELAKTKGQAMAILNTPSIKDFKNSLNPRFTTMPTASNPNPLLKTEYIASGGNLSLNPPFKFGLASETTGGKFVGYFAPYLTIRENSRNKSVPPAMYVANNFVRKFINGTPYAIVAGRTRGLIEDREVVGLEYNFDLSDREYLEPFGINPIITKRGIGIEIYANQTSFQSINSAFNNLHVRDLLITLEGGIEQIGENYVFEFNNSSIRLEIEATVKTFLEDVKANGGLLDYKVIMNSTNNPGAIIDQNFGILDVIIEPPSGIQKFINRITVTKTGAIAQGGFTLQ